jgi:hypothetical protein
MEITGSRKHSRRNHFCNLHWILGLCHRTRPRVFHKLSIISAATRRHVFPIRNRSVQLGHLIHRHPYFMDSVIILPFSSYSAFTYSVWSDISLHSIAIFDASNHSDYVNSVKERERFVKWEWTGVASTGIKRHCFDCFNCVFILFVLCDCHVQLKTLQEWDSQSTDRSNQSLMIWCLIWLRI